MSNDFAKTLSDRINRTLSLNIEKAKQGGVVAFGTWQPRWIEVGPRDGRNKLLPNAKFSFNDHADTVKGIVHAYLKGKSMIQIARELNNKDVPTIGGGKQWSQSTVGHIVSSESLIGNLKIKQVIKIDDDKTKVAEYQFPKYYPAVITNDEWNQLQARLSQNNSRKGGLGKGKRVLNLFPNLCKCSVCGGSVSTFPQLSVL